MLSKSVDKDGRNASWNTLLPYLQFACTQFVGHWTSLVNRSKQVATVSHVLAFRQCVSGTLATQALAGPLSSFFCMHVDMLSHAARPLIFHLAML